MFFERAKIELKFGRRPNSLSTAPQLHISYVKREKGQIHEQNRHYN